MKEIVFLVEERSAKAMLESVLPRLLPPNSRYRIIPFEGKQDLEKQMTARIRGYQNQDAQFIILRDQDSAPDCTTIKQRLLDRCAESGKRNHCLVRIACTELESFYLADLAAVEQGLNITGLQKLQGTKKYRHPDRLGSPSHELKLLTKNRYEKIAGSRDIGRHLALDNERSCSFKHLISGIHRLHAK